MKFDLATGAVSGTAQVPAGQNPVPMASPHDNLLITQTNDGNAPNYAVSRDGGQTWSRATLQGGLPSLPAASLQPRYPVTS